jgi:2-iminobutanoate/2-iminopropanoate deaminase
MKTIIQTDTAPAAVGPYSQAVSAGGFCFVSGQIGLDPATGALVAGGVAEQCARALDNVAAVLEAAGCSLSDVVKANVYLASMADFKTVNGIYQRYFTEDFPARAAIEVGGLPLGALVEISVVAHRR